MTTQYEKLLATVPCFRQLDRRELRIVAGLVDVVLVPAGRPISPSQGETIAGVQGATTTDAYGRILALTPLRMYVFGRRELRSLLEALPDVAQRFRTCAGTTPSDLGAVRGAGALVDQLLLGRM